MTEEDLKNNIILDSGSSIDIFRKPQVFTYINRSNQVIHLYTNVVSKINQIQVMVQNYGKLWYDDKAIPITFSLSNLVNKYIVVYDSNQYEAFTVHTNTGIIRFRRNKQWIYVFNTTYTKVNSNVVTTVGENIVVFTNIKIERSKLARKI